MNPCKLHKNFSGDVCPVCLRNENDWWKEQAQSLANIAIKHGIISRGKYAEVMKIDRCDVDETIENWWINNKEEKK